MPSLLSKPIGPTGLGLMGMTWRPSPQPFSKSHKTMAFSLTTSPPTNFWNGGEIYGPPEKNSLHLLREYFDAHPQDAEKVVLSIKGGSLPGQLIPDGSEKNIRRSVDDCNAILAGRKKIDIFQSARVDPKTPIEESLKVYKSLVEEGKIGGVGLSEVSAATIRRAASIVPIAAVEVELSLWATDILHNGIVTTCAELGIPIAAYSPLSRGALTDTTPFRASQLPDTDFRKTLPKFQDGVVEHNLAITREVRALAERKGCTLPQVALAWVRQIGGKFGATIVPIPGATTMERVRENSTVVRLTEEEMEELQGVVERVEVKGGRYGGPMAALMDA